MRRPCSLVWPIGWFVRRLTRLLLCAAVLLPGGCARYHAKPLDDQAIERELAGPDDNALHVAASELSHPALEPVSLDLARGLTPDEVAVVAVVTHPSLRAERDQRQIAAAQLLQAGLLPNPQLTAGVELPYNADPPDDFTGYNVGLDWEVTSLITRDQKRRAASATVASVALDVAWKEWQVAQEARTAAYGVIALQEQLRATRDADEQLAQNLAVVRRAVDRHELTLLELAAAETSAQDAHAAVLSQEKDLAHQRIALTRAMGWPSEREVLLRAGQPLPSSLTPLPAPELAAGLQSRRLDLLALRRGYDSQNATLRAAVLAQFPRISFGGGTARDTSNIHTLTLGITVDVPLFDRNQAVIATENATRQKLYDEFVTRLFEARSDIATAISDINASNAQIAAAEAAIPGLERLVQTHEAALKRGNVDVLSFYAARGALFQKRISVLTLKQQLLTSWIALELAAGRYLPIPVAATTSTTNPTTQESHP
jgi:outer membrane protein TolC